MKTSLDHLQLQPVKEPEHHFHYQAPAASVTSLPGAADKPLEQLRFEFTGTGMEYFRIWVVNLLLTVLTLGVYSAWAKVRRLQYFYRNTRVDGSTFDYHGNPKSILKGRVLALFLVVAYKVAYELSAIAAGIVGLLLVVLIPWLLARSFRFKLINSSYRGLRFRFAGTALDAYRTLSLFPILAVLIAFYAWNVWASGLERMGVMSIVLGLIVLVVAAGTVPLAHHLLKQFQHNNAYFGQTPVFYDGKPVDFFKIYGKAVGFLLLGVFSAGLFAVLTGGIFASLEKTAFGWLFALMYGVASAYAFYLFVTPYLQSRVQNLVWQHTEMGGVRFISTARGRELLFIHATNLLFITLSFGLYKPFGIIRLMKYRIESLNLIPDGSLEEFLCDHAGDNTGAIGQEAGDLFDIEIAL
jgi:uncharacterized membrane protein YjgN (DUF898 family)